MKLAPPCKEVVLVRVSLGRKAKKQEGRPRSRLVDCTRAISRRVAMALTKAMIRKTDNDEAKRMDTKEVLPSVLSHCNDWDSLRCSLY